MDLLDEKMADIESRYSGPVYHYTDANALLNILKKKDFWVSKSDFMNDPKEFNHAEKIYLELFKEIGEEKIKKLMEFIKSPFIHQFFILSFSIDPDSLTLWSNYSTTEGYNLGFDSNDLIDTFNKRSFPCFGGKVIYEKDEFKEIVRNEVNAIKDYIERDLTEEEADDARMPFVMNVAALSFAALFYKSEVFREEEEYRIVFIITNEMLKWEQYKIHYRTKANAITPFIKVPNSPEPDGKITLKSITIGPKNNIDIAYNGLKHFLETNGYTDFSHVELIKSEIPLRY
jgi:hypothetical protein